MKKIFALLLAITCSISLVAQTFSGTWNTRTATYTNTAHSLKWQLMDNLTWIGRPILSEDTLFKVRNDDTHILIKLGATKGEDGNRDAWDFISMFQSSQFQAPYKQQAQQNGMSFLGLKAAKDQLCGIHAIKTRSDMKKYYPEHKQTVHSIEIIYTVYRRGYMYTVSVAALSVIENEIELFDNIANELFKGFSFE